MNNNLNDSLIVYDTLKVKLTANKELSELVDTIEQTANQDTNGMDLFIKYGIPLLTLIIIGLALYVSWRVLKITREHNENSIKTTRKHNELSLKPYLIFRASTNHREGQIKLYIANKGLGPCFFDKFDIIYDGVPYDRMYKVFVKINKKLGYSDKNYNMDYRLFVAPLNGYGLTANEKKTLIKYQLSGFEGSIKKKSLELYDEYKKISFKYSYKDLYENVTPDDFNYGRDYDTRRTEDLI